MRTRHYLQRVARHCACALGFAAAGSAAWAVQTWSDFDGRGLGRRTPDTACNSTGQGAAQNPAPGAAPCGYRPMVGGVPIGHGITGDAVTATGPRVAATYRWGARVGTGSPASAHEAAAGGAHGTDNPTGQDAVLLNFTLPANLAPAKSGWSGNDRPAGTKPGGMTDASNDADLSVFSWTWSDAPASVHTVANGTTMPTNEGWQLVSNFANVGIAGETTGTPGTARYASHWLIGAFNPDYGAADAGIDAIKVFALSAQACSSMSLGVGCSSGSGTTGKAPEPAAFDPESMAWIAAPGLLAVVGVVALAAIGLRRRRAAAAADPQN